MSYLRAFPVPLLAPLRQNQFKMRQSHSMHENRSLYCCHMPTYSQFLIMLFFFSCFFLSPIPYFKCWRAALFQLQSVPYLFDASEHTQACHASSGVRRRRQNLRFKGNQAPEFVIRQAKLFNGDIWLEEPMDIHVREGVIQDISPKIVVSDSGIIEMFANGRPVTPGLVDIHSHSGVDPLPYNPGFYDLYELSSDRTPYVRTIDAIYTADASIPIIASGGVTTSLILPGSTNIIGGEAYAIKNRIPDSLSIKEMLVEGLETHGTPQRYMKFACGSNPKKFHQKFPERAKSRMGMSWALREHFDRARTLKIQQDRWDEAALKHKSNGDRPFSLELESTVAILRGQMRTNFHCYAPHDMETILRIANEFDFKVHAFHHANDAHLVPDLLKGSKSNITIALFSGFGLYSMESYRLSVFAAKLLEAQNISVAVHSDHPWTNAKHLAYEAALNHYHGQSEIAALRSFTAIPAITLGLEHRIGYAKVGYDADLVLWDDHPLQLGATPVQVWIDGEGLIPIQQPIQSPPESIRLFHAPNQWSSNKPSRGCEIGGRDIIVRGISKSFLEDLHIYGNDNILVMEAGEVVCMGRCPVEKRRLMEKGASVMTLKDGHVVPGVTAFGQALGLSEIDDDPSTKDGLLSSDSLDLADILYTTNGLSFSGKHLEFARRGGVLYAVTSPNCGGLVDAPKSLFRGVSAAIRTGGESVHEKGAVIKDEAALHIRIGQDGKGSKTPTISSQISTVRKYLKSSDCKIDILRKIQTGDVPLVVETGNKDVIAHVLNMKRDFPSVRFVILGGEEAWMLANELAAAKVPVILNPWRCLPKTFETRHCLPGPPTTESSISILHRAGVDLALGLYEDSFARNLWLEAGWAKKWANLTDTEAAALVTTNVERILGIDNVMTQGRQKRNFVIFEGDPMALGSRIATIVEEHTKVKRYRPEMGMGMGVQQTMGSMGQESTAGGGITDCWPDPE